MISRGLVENGDNVTVMAPVSYADFQTMGFPDKTAFLSLGRSSIRILPEILNLEQGTILKKAKTTDFIIEN